MNQTMEYYETPISSFSTSFNLTSNAKPDIRNAKYVSPTDHLDCPVCQQPFIEPMTTICGHTFCRECIMECLKMGKPRDDEEPTSSDIGRCPLDRTPINPSNVYDLFPTPLIISNLIDELRVGCLNHERGCDWVGCRWELDRHVQIDCGYTGVRCNGKRPKKMDGGATKAQEEQDGLDEVDEEDRDEEEDEIETEGELDEDEKVDYVLCDQIVERRFASDSCCHKVYECDFCTNRICDVTKSTHLETECLFNYQTCDLCQNDMIPAKHMEKHRQNCVTVGRMTCPASKIGCKWVGTSETTLEIHLAQCQLGLLLPTIQRMQAESDSLSTENKFLQRQINKILDSIIQGKVTNLGYTEQLEEINDSKGEPTDDKLLYLSFELDRLKYEMNDRVLPFIAREGPNDPVVNNLINDNYLMREDLNLQRMLINSLRKQLQFLLFRSKVNNQATHRGMEEMELLEVVSRSSSEERLNLKL